MSFGKDAPAEDEMQDAVTPLSDAAFKDCLRTVTPHLRAFARKLCGDPDFAADLVQDALLNAWASRARFRAGSNFRAWAFAILRNLFYTQVRRRRFVGAWDDLVADRLLAAPAGQESAVQFGDLLHALQCLPPGQREAIILVGAGGVTYEDAAAITGTAIGTVKSRVARARQALEQMMETGFTPARMVEAGPVARITSVTGLLDYMEDLRTSPQPVAPPRRKLAA